MSSMRQRWSSIAGMVMIAAFAVFCVLLIDDLHIDDLHRRHAERLSQLEGRRDDADPDAYHPDGGAAAGGAARFAAGDPASAAAATGGHAEWSGDCAEFVAVAAGAESTVKYVGVGTAVVFLGGAVVLAALAFSPDRARGWMLQQHARSVPTRTVPIRLFELTPLA